MSTLFEILHSNTVSKENAELVKKFYNGEIVNAPDGLGLKLEAAKNWYGIPGIKFIFWNEWSDPGIVYKNHYINSFIVEDSMWEVFSEEVGMNDEYSFTQFMLDNKEQVYEFCEVAIGNEI